MFTFVLVHGAFQGSWCWRDTATVLRQLGHEVLTPTLTGQGDRAHELDPEVGLDTHVADVVSLLDQHDLHDVHLVLHGYAGVLAGPIAEKASARLDAVIYLGAFITRPGESLLDVQPPETALRCRNLVFSDGDGWRLPANDSSLEQMGITDPALRAEIASHLTDFPFRCQTDPARYTTTSLWGVRQVYVVHTDPPLRSLERSLEAARSEEWEIRELPVDHNILVTAPQLVAGELDRVASTYAWLNVDLRRRSALTA